MNEQKRIDLANVGPGLAWAFEFDENGKGRALSVDEPVDLMHGRRFIWAHFILSNPRTRNWIAAQEALPREACSVLLSADGHPRLDWSGDALWGVLFDAQRELDSVTEEPTDLRFVVRPQFVVTARHHPSSSASALKSKVEEGATFENSASLFERLLEAIADSVGAAAHRISLAIDGIEDRVLSESASDESAPILRLRRSIIPTGSSRIRSPERARTIGAAARGNRVAGLLRYRASRAAAGGLLSLRPAFAGRPRSSLAGGSLDAAHPATAAGGRGPFAQAP